MILTVGQNVEFPVKLKVVKAFAHNDCLYYIVIVDKKNTVLSHLPGPLWGCLNTDGSVESIPVEVMDRAKKLVSSLNLESLE